MFWDLCTGSSQLISQTLLFHRHQLPEERVGAENVDESEQEELGGRSHSAGLSAAQQVRRKTEH